LTQLAASEIIGQTGRLPIGRLAQAWPQAARRLFVVCGLNERAAQLISSRIYVRSPQSDAKRIEGINQDVGSYACQIAECAASSTLSRLDGALP
jgi:hypothetical protein